MALAACGLFGDEKDLEFEPAKLIKFKPTIEIKRLWTANLGGDAEFLRLGLQPAGDGSRIYAASQDGSVTAFDPVSGKRLWRTELEVDLSAGPGVGDGLVVVTSTDGLIILLDAADGSERWRVNIHGESLARPLIANGAIIVQTVDNRLRALQAFDGSERWGVKETMPALTMRGSTAPIMSGNNVVAGFDNGYVIAVDMESGDITWRSFLAPPSGRSDLERLSDIDGAMAIVGQDIYAAGYQGRIASIAAESGQVLWSTEISSHVGVSADWTSLYTTQETGVLIAMARRNGAESWRQESLFRREPTLPVPFHTTVAVGDLDGYVHFFSSLDGAPVARVRLGSKAITSNPLVVADRLYVQSDAGSIAAYIVVDPKRPQNVPDIADDEGA
jgi:outer membrane protein assembly factor BamB